MYGSWASLDLVEEEKRFAGDDALSVPDLDEGDEPLDVKGLFDVLPHLVVRLKIDFDERLKTFRKAADGCGFTDLSRAAHKERFVTGIVLPFDQCVVDLAI